MKICLLGSGSRGNSIYFEHRRDALLIDQGFSHKQAVERLASRGLDTSKIRAIFVSHEHNDHMRGVGISARKLGVPVYGTPGTFTSCRKLFNGEEKQVPIESGEAVRIGEMEVLPFSVSHDALDPVQFSISAGKKKVAIATDLGFVSTLVEERLRNADLVIVEANHDVEMLKKGSYPWELKQRIMSRKGHLSNRNAAELIFNLSQAGTRNAVLAHVSQENNDPELAERAVRELFERFDRRLRILLVAVQDEASEIIEV